MKTNYKKNNPFILETERTQTLDEAYQIFIDTFLEYAEKYDLSENEIVLFKEEIKKAYLMKKSLYLLEDKLSKFSDFLNNALCDTIKNDENDYITNIYYKRNSHLITND